MQSVVQGCVLPVWSGFDSRVTGSVHCMGELCSDVT